MDLTEFSQLLVNGIAVGCIIALAAVGLTLTYSILNLSNFAHGDFMTLGAYLTYASNASGLPIVISIMIGIIGTVAAMLISEQLLWKKMRQRRATPTTLIIISIGLALFIRSAILFIWGSSNQRYNLPIAEALDFFSVKIPMNRIIIMILALIAMIALHFLLTKTKIGKAMRAVADNLELARVSGINVEKVVFWTWIITGTLTALGGAMYGFIAVRPLMGWLLILPMFASIILGGIGNPYGAISGALVIGVAQELTVPFFGAEYKLGVALLIMILILLFRPQGLFSK